MVFSVFHLKLICTHNFFPMRRKKRPYIIRLIKLSLKCIWHALTAPNDPFHNKEVNFWNMPVRKREKRFG